MILLCPLSKYCPCMQITCWNIHWICLAVAANDGTNDGKSCLPYCKIWEGGRRKGEGGERVAKHENHKREKFYIKWNIWLRTIFHPKETLNWVECDAGLYRKFHHWHRVFSRIKTFQLSLQTCLHLRQSMFDFSFFTANLSFFHDSFFFKSFDLISVTQKKHHFSETRRQKTDIEIPAQKLTSEREKKESKTK